MTICSALRIGIAICFLLTLGVTAQSPSVGRAEATEAEYEVFQHTLSQSFVGAIGEDRIGKPNLANRDFELHRISQQRPR